MTDHAALGSVAIVGRPNVGKSTLVNRIVGRREAIVAAHPGVTRDRKQLDATWQGRSFAVVDTGGWLPGADPDGVMDAKVSAQSERSMREADVVVMVVDSQVGITEEDDAVATLLRRLPAPVLLAVNKVDDSGHEPAVWEFSRLGLGDPFPVSALHGRGVGDLLDDAVRLLEHAQTTGAGGPEAAGGAEAEAAPSDLEPPVSGTDDSDSDNLVSVAIVGRPNVGKSTLFNRLIGDDRAVVHDKPGTTRDTIDTVVATPLGPVRFVDTAGMRRRARINAPTEYYSLLRALAAVDRADVALLVVDATVGVTHQDQRLAERIDAAGCPVVILLNKWEVLDAEARAEVTAGLARRLHFVGDSAVLKVSALSGLGVHRLLPCLGDVVDDYRRRIPTQAVNRCLRDAQAAQPAPAGARVLYATQGATDPPTFTLFTNRTLPRTYLRYLERSLRETFDLGAVPIKLRTRRRSD